MNNFSPAPIVIFSYNRLAHLKITISALKKNYLAKSSELIIFSDGPKKNIENDNTKILEIRNYLHKINGFKNHHWNGVTTYAFGKVISGIIKSNLKIPQIVHLVPKNSVNKFNLLKIFKKLFLRQDIIILPVNSKDKINRTLKTTYTKLNKKIWKCAGYNVTPTLEYLIKEIV